MEQCDCARAMSDLLGGPSATEVLREMFLELKRIDVSARAEMISRQPVRPQYHILAIILGVHGECLDLPLRIEAFSDPLVHAGVFAFQIPRYTVVKLGRQPGAIFAKKDFFGRLDVELIFAVRR